MRKPGLLRREIHIEAILSRKDPMSEKSLPYRQQERRSDSVLLARLLLDQTEVIITRAFFVDKPVSRDIDRPPSRSRVSRGFSVNGG